MHILLIHQAFVSPDEGGGTRHYELARHCVQQGYRFTIVASAVSYLSGQRVLEEKKLVVEQRMDDIRVLRAYAYPALHKSFIWRMVSFLSFMVTSVYAGLKAGPVDLVMGTSPPLFQAISAWVVASLRRCPLLLEIRDLWPEFAIDMGVLTNPILIKLARWLETFLYARATHLVVNSPAYRQYLLDKGIPANKISVIPNGVDPTMFEPSSHGGGLRQRWGLKDKFVVTYAGALGMANDIPTILRAAKQLQDHSKIHFVLVGDGKERQNLEAMAREWNLANVTFMGVVRKSEMPQVLAASDACVATLKDIPMFRTTYPNKVFDYMAAGRPTLLAIDGVIREVVESAEGGIFIPPGDAGVLANSTLWLSQNRDKATRMGEAARHYVVEYFNRSDHADQFVVLIRQLSG